MIVRPASDRVRRTDGAAAERVQRVDHFSLRLDAASVSRPANLPGMLDVWGVATRVGVFAYDGEEPGSVFYEYRPRDEVMAPQSLATLRGVPFTIDHPTDDVTAGNVQQLTHGWVLDVRADGDLVKVQVRIATEDAQRAIDTGTVELSCGYSARLERRAGFAANGERYDAIQRDIRYNHLALVDLARAGHVARLHLDSTARVQRRDQGRRPMKRYKLRHDGKTFACPELVVAGLQAAADAVRSDAAIEVAKITIEQDGEAPVELVVPKGMAEQALAMLGAVPSEAASASSDEPPPAETPPPAATTDAEEEEKLDESEEEMKADKAKIAKIVDAAIKAALPGAVKAALGDATKALRSDARARADLERLVVPVLGDGYRYADADDHQVRADALKTLDPKRADAARLLAERARKGDAAAAGELKAHLDHAIEADRSKRDDSARLMETILDAGPAPTPEGNPLDIYRQERIDRRSGHAATG